MEQKLNKFKRKLQKNKATDAEFFKVHGLLEYGFPPNASALAYDTKLSLLALGTSTGEVRLFGKSGVQLIAKHEKAVHVFQLIFIPNQGRIISHGSDGDNSVISLFETNSRDGSDVLQLKKTVQAPKKVTTCALASSSEFLLVGTEVGDVYKLNVEKFKEFEEDVIHLDVAMQNVPDDFKVNPGGVEAIELHPVEENLVLIGYSKGLLVLWDLVDHIPQGTFFTSCKNLESVTWYKDSSRFLSSHEDGSYFIWSKDPEKQYSGGPQQVFPFGEEESAKKIPKIKVLLTKNEEEYIIFAGGLSKDTYASTNSVTVKRGNSQVNFELSSKFIDFVCIPEPSTDEDNGFDRPNALFILTEDELIAVDLQTEGSEEKSQLWPVFNKPYLNSASPSDLTSLYVYEDCEQSFVDSLRASGKQVSVDVSPRDWPIIGGKVLANSGTVSVLVTGHYDGAVRFYDVNSGSFELLYTLNLTNYFKSEELDEEHEHESLGDVKLRKVGADFGACVDDSRYAVCKIYICPKTHAVVIGSHSGQVVVFDLGDSNQSNTESN
jgi:lethal(2) giant larvae protein